MDILFFFHVLLNVALPVLLLKWGCDSKAFHDHIKYEYLI